MTSKTKQVIGATRPGAVWLGELASCRTKLRFGLISLAIFTNVSFAETIRGEVIAIADGDTVTVLDELKVQHKVRLAAIDAPEKRQAFGERSKQRLSSRIYRQEVTVVWKKRDRYGRVVGLVLFNGKDICLEQIREGMAWHYVEYAREQPSAERTAYAAAEAQARALKVGLWSEPASVAPWSFRKAKRQASAGFP